MCLVFLRSLRRLNNGLAALALGRWGLVGGSWCPRLRLLLTPRSGVCVDGVGSLLSALLLAEAAE
jgi:hypothetical protein